MSAETPVPTPDYEATLTTSDQQRDALFEAVASTRIDGSGPEWSHVIAVVENIVREAKADAWREGYSDGHWGYCINDIHTYRASGTVRPMAESDDYEARVKALMPTHPFVLLLDQHAVEGHVFGDLKVKVAEDYIPVERRCRLCGKLPIQLLLVSGGIARCEGLHLRDGESL
jgi:hypothetical protein